MDPVANGPETFRFGLFDVNPSTGELRKHGRKVRLQEQPFQVLVQLVRSPGEVVTREELQKAIWTEGTFVDFELGLNTAVKKLRRALGDSHDHPRFIETLPRRGYRLLVPVQRIDSAGSTRSHATSVAGKRKWLLITTLLLSMAGAATWWYLRRTPSKSVSRADRFTLTHLTWASGFTGNAALSPDGKFVAYTSDRAEGNVDIWVQQIGSTSAIRLTDHKAADSDPSFSPDGRTIVFRSQREGGGIFSVPTLGGQAKWLAKHGTHPHFSPDGSLIAYSVGTSGFSGVQAFIIPVRGGPPRQLLPAFQYAALPIWLPDGRLLISGQHPELGGDLWVTSVSGDFLERTGASEVLTKQGIFLSSLDDWAGPRRWKSPRLSLKSDRHFRDLVERSRLR